MKRFSLIPTLVALLLLGALLVTPAKSRAAVGDPILIASPVDVVVTFLGANTDFHDSLVAWSKFDLDSGGVNLQDHVVSHNLFTQASAVGDSVNLGSYPAGYPLLFELTNTSFDEAMTGPLERTGTAGSVAGGGTRLMFDVGHSFAETADVRWLPGGGAEIGFRDRTADGAAANFDDYAMRIRISNVAAVPEPSTWLLLGAGLLVVVVLRKWSRRGEPDSSPAAV